MQRKFEKAVLERVLKKVARGLAEIKNVLTFASAF
jgi:hypothetical protein